MWSEEKGTNAAGILEDDMRDVLDDINVTQTKRCRPPNTCKVDLCFPFNTAKMRDSALLSFRCISIQSERRIFRARAAAPVSGIVSHLVASHGRPC